MPMSRSASIASACASTSCFVLRWVESEPACRRRTDVVHIYMCGAVMYIGHENVSMSLCNTIVSPLLSHWRHCSLALSHRFYLGVIDRIQLADNCVSYVFLHLYLFRVWLRYIRGHFDDEFSSIVKIRWTFEFVLIKILIVRSLWYFVIVFITVLSQHLQNMLAIYRHKWNYAKTIFHRIWIWPEPMLPESVHFRSVLACLTRWSLDKMAEFADDILKRT